MSASRPAHPAIPASQNPGEQTFQRHQCVFTFLPLRWTERPKIQIDRAACQRVRHGFHQQEVGGASQNEVACPPERVHRSLHRQQNLWRSLHFIEDDGARSQQRVGIAFGLIEYTDIIESEIRPCGFNRLRECGLAGLPRARQYGDVRMPAGGFTQPSLETRVGSRQE